jgi:hypothetical protein
MGLDWSPPPTATGPAPDIRWLVWLRSCLTGLYVIGDATDKGDTGSGDEGLMLRVGDSDVLLPPPMAAPPGYCGGGSLPSSSMVSAPGPGPGPAPEIPEGERPGCLDTALLVCRGVGRPYTPPPP